MNNPERITDAERTILETLRTLSYGALEVTVHDARIVQIQKTEKLRLPAAPK